LGPLAAPEQWMKALAEKLAPRGAPEAEPGAPQHVPPSRDQPGLLMLRADRVRGPEAREPRGRLPVTHRLAASPARGHVGAPGHALDNRLYPLGTDPVVVINEANQLVPGFSEPAVTRVAETSPGLVDEAHRRGSAARPQVPRD